MSFLNQSHSKDGRGTFKYAINYCSFFNILTLERRHWSSGLSCKSTSCKGEKILISLNKIQKQVFPKAH